MRATENSKVSSKLANLYCLLAEKTGQYYKKHAIRVIKRALWQLMSNFNNGRTVVSTYFMRDLNAGLVNSIATMFVASQATYTYQTYA